MDERLQELEGNDKWCEENRRAWKKLINKHSKIVCVEPQSSATNRSETTAASDNKYITYYFVFFLHAWNSFTVYGNCNMTHN